jgi:large subunit ribosomal protein L29
MSLPKFTDIISFSNKEISEEIIKTEKEIFNLRFKKATRQTFKPNELKNAKRKLAQLKTLLGTKLEETENSKEASIDNLISN